MENTPATIYISKHELASAFGVTVTRVNQMIAANMLPFVVHGKRKEVPRAAFNTFVANECQKALQNLAA